MSMKGIKRQKKNFKKRLYFCKRFFCFVFFLIQFSTLFSQSSLDFENPFKAKKSFYFTWDSKITFISNEFAQIKSVKLGFDFGGKTKFGIGYNWYKGDMVRNFGEDYTVDFAKLKFRYASIFTEYVYFLNRHWEATIPAQIGLGSLSYIGEADKLKKQDAGGLFMLYEPSSTLTYRVLRYFGVGLGVGYRLVILNGDNPFKENFQSPIITIRTKIYFDTVMEDLKKKFDF